MSGFVGFTGTASAPTTIDKQQVLTAMLEAIVHRGQEQGHYLDEQIALGARQWGRTLAKSEVALPKLDKEFASAKLPICHAEQSMVLAFDGQIYNAQELRVELEQQGYAFSSSAPSEVLVHGYEEYGLDILLKLRGMFAFALWDKRQQSLLLARDFFGIKPLYYTQNTRDASFIFGSEIKSFLKYPAFQKELNKAALKPYLTFQYSVLEETFFKGVYKLQPGHYLLYRQGQIEIESYWDAQFAEQDKSFAEYVQLIRETLLDSVSSHQQGEQGLAKSELGSFLSGGIDSSYITALLKPQKTFSVGFQDYAEIFNETNHAESLAAILKLENHKKMLTAEECFASLPTIQYHLDEPQSNPSCVPLYFLAELASQHVPIVLSGEGADELFGGYAWYEKTRAMQIYTKIPFLLRRFVSKLCAKLPAHRITSFLVKGGLKVEESFIGQAKVFAEEDALRVLRAEYHQAPSIHSITDKVYAQVQDKDDLTKMQYVDLKLWLPGDILLKADKLTAAHSLEVRVPFLDRLVFSVAAQLPSSFRVNEQQSKYALRTAAESVLPQEWARRTKLGFPVPIRHWLREEKYYQLVEEKFQSSVAAQFFHPEVLLDFLEQHYAEKHNYARYIWTVYVFLVWYEEFFAN